MRNVDSSPFNNWIMINDMSFVVYLVRRAVHGSCKRGFQPHSKLLFNKSKVVVCFFFYVLSFFPALLRGALSPLEIAYFIEVIKKKGGHG